MRTCVGCRRTRGADGLFRVVRTADGSLAVGRALPGRGAWLCRESPGCLDQAVKRRAFSRALRVEVRSGEVGRLRSALQSRRGEEKVGPGSGAPGL